MKRSLELTPLSHDHHQALFQAMRLKRAQPENVGEVLGDFLDFWFGVGYLHFRAEEEVLLPAYSAYGDVSREEVVRVLVDHAEIRREARFALRDPFLRRRSAARRTSWAERRSRRRPSGCTRWASGWTRTCAMRSGCCSR